MRVKQKPAVESSPDSTRFSGREKRPLRMAAFLFFSIVVTLAMFWPAAVGKKLFVPLDIAPNLFSKFRYVDPAATGVPANHWAIDLIYGDISRNFLVYQAWR